MAMENISVCGKNEFCLSFFFPVRVLFQDVALSLVVTMNAVFKSVKGLELLCSCSGTCFKKVVQYS